MHVSYNKIHPVVLIIMLLQLSYTERKNISEIYEFYGFMCQLSCFFRVKTTFLRKRIYLKNIAC